MLLLLVLLLLPEFIAAAAVAAIAAVAFIARRARYRAHGASLKLLAPLVQRIRAAVLDPEHLPLRPPPPVVIAVVLGPPGMSWLHHWMRGATLIRTHPATARTVPPTHIPTVAQALRRSFGCRRLNAGVTATWPCRWGPLSR